MIWKRARPDTDFIVADLAAATSICGEIMSTRSFRIVQDVVRKLVAEVKMKFVCVWSPVINSSNDQWDVMRLQDGL